MGTATRKAQRMANKVQALSFDSTNPTAARKELLRMTTQRQWHSRNPNPGRGAKSLHKPEHGAKAGLLSAAKRNPQVVSF